MPRALHLRSRIVSSCATSQDWTVTELDRAHGVELVSCEAEDLEAPPIAMKQANSIATRRCETLGYSG